MGTLKWEKMFGSEDYYLEESNNLLEGL